ncbi:DUF4339 domain-containing protein [Rubritalea profundi]|uniref:GYF domain-containing protein n=1 Tax=Rubritalea profundi TaxID=1658618 RepID=A0A2S7U1G8_9BACT|nr:DUF4339 domain-containing protein [Rubritalea profundi]PQJ28856.1 hypothetical protein BSZ32_10380 [Rubritalea profundi]
MSEPQWHYLDAQNQQQGPVTGAQLQALTAQGQIVQTTQVWTDGLEAWIPASQVEGLFAATPAPAAQAPEQSAYAAPTTDPTPTGGQYPSTIVTGASFGKLIGLFAGAIVFLIIGGLVANGQTANHATAGTGIAIIGYIMLLILSILPYIYLYKAWRCLQPGGATITPGKAVGFLFIPLFNYYWIFVAMGGLPRQWNEIMDRYENTQDAPRLSIGAFVCLLLLPGVGFFIWAYQIIKAINFMVSLSKMSYASNPTGVVGGGLNFGPAHIPTKK